MNEELYENMQTLILSHIRDFLNFFYENNEFFDIVIYHEFCEFNPMVEKLPKDKLMMLSLQNYTFESIVVEDEFMVFEAGFGKANTHTYVKVPFVAIYSIMNNNNHIFVNPVKPKKKKKPKNIFAQNPNNL